jgi:uncharacterized protein YcgI (DUF1989 family)
MEMTRRAIVVPGGEGRAFTVRMGEQVTIVDVEGRQAADFVAMCLDDPREKLSPVHTRRALRSLFFQVGAELFSNFDRPLFRVLEDTVGIHDANVPACDNTRYTVDFGVERHRNCLQNLHEGLVQQGMRISAHDVPEPFNLFQNGPITPDGRMRVTDPTSRAGDHITLLALRDMTCAVSSCPQDIIPGNGLEVTPIEIVVSAPESAG